MYNMRTITRKTNVRRHDRHLPSKVADVRKHQRTVTRQMLGTIPVKDLTYPQAKKRYPWINPNADYDGDGVPNKKDCRPFDEERQDDADANLYLFNNLYTPYNKNDPEDEMSVFELFLGDTLAFAGRPTPSFGVDTSNKTYIGQGMNKELKDLSEEEQLKKVSEVLSHEAIHHVLTKEQGEDVSGKFDNITSKEKKYRDIDALDKKIKKWKIWWDEGKPKNTEMEKFQSIFGSYEEGLNHLEERKKELNKMIGVKNYLDGLPE